jgi:predicted TIM-barrel fold metal-dependent hydrolase
MRNIGRREWIAGLLCAGKARSARPKGLLIESHVHLYADDTGRFPFANGGGRRRSPYTVESFLAFANEAKIDRAVIVTPEPYQDDHRYLEYCLDRAPSRDFFRSSCLFDPIDPRTPQRLAELVKKTGGAVVALRIHEMHEPGTPSTTSGMIRDRDMRHPQMMESWRAASDLGLMIQMHFIPYYARQIGELASKFPKMPVLLDHLARAGHGKPEDFDEVLKLAALPRVYMKYSGTGVSASSREPYPHPDAKPIVRRAFDAFGADRMVWGELGNDMANFEKAIEIFNTMFDFASEADRAKIRGLTAHNLFGFR